MLPGPKLDAVTFRCRTPSGIQTPELGALSSTWDVLRAKGSILLDGIQPRGNQREALETKHLVILPWTGRYFSMLQSVHVLQNSKCARYILLFNECIFYSLIQFAFHQHAIGRNFLCLRMVENNFDVPALAVFFYVIVFIIT